jgi:hypothetical protein
MVDSVKGSGCVPPILKRLGWKYHQDGMYAIVIICILSSVYSTTSSNKELSCQYISKCTQNTDITKFTQSRQGPVFHVRITDPSSWQMLLLPMPGIRTVCTVYIIPTHPELLCILVYTLFSYVCVQCSLSIFAASISLEINYSLLIYDKLICLLFGFLLPLHYLHRLVEFSF